MRCGAERRPGCAEPAVHRQRRRHPPRRRGRGLRARRAAPTWRASALPWPTPSTPSAPAVTGLDAEAAELVQLIADALLAGKRPLIVSGASLGEKSIIEAAAQHRPGPEEPREERRPSAWWCRKPTAWAWPCSAATRQTPRWNALTTGKADAVIVLENDLYRRADAAKVDAALAARQGGDRRRPPAHRHHRHGPPGAVRIQLRRRRRHPGQPGRPCPALLPGVRAELLRQRHPGARGLALAARAAQHPAGQGRRLDPAGPGHRRRAPPCSSAAGRASRMPRPTPRSASRA